MGGGGEIVLICDNTYLLIKLILNLPLKIYGKGTTQAVWDDCGLETLFFLLIKAAKLRTLKDLNLEQHLLAQHLIVDIHAKFGFLIIEEISCWREISANSSSHSSW